MPAGTQRPELRLEHHRGSGLLQRRGLQPHRADRSGRPFNHSSGDCTIVGGYVYRGTRYPALEGGYVFGDYCSGAIRVLSAAHAVATGTATPVDAGRMDGTLTSFGQGDDGELYAVDYQGGRILHVVGTPRQ